MWGVISTVLVPKCITFPVACLFRDFRKEFGGDCYINPRCIKIR